MRRWILFAWRCLIYNTLHRVLRRVSYFLYVMTTSVRFCLSFDSLNWNFIAFEMNINSVRKHSVYTDVVNDGTYTRQSVITRIVIRFSWPDLIHRIKATSYDKFDFTSIYSYYHSLTNFFTSKRILLLMARLYQENSTLTQLLFYFYNLSQRNLTWRLLLMNWRDAWIHNGINMFNYLLLLEKIFFYLV